MLKGFPPIAAQGARLLILGSMPSVASLDQHQYYARPQNAFWKIMGDLYQATVSMPYEQRVSRLSAAGVAVWDVVASCIRPGSLDSAIDMQSVVVNDFAAFFISHPNVSHVYFNGRKAEDIYRRFVLADVGGIRPDLVYTALPSTSPAMATLNYAAKLARWQVLTET